MRRFLAILMGDESAWADEGLPRFDDAQVSAAALMVEAARLDGTFGADERQRIETLLERRMGLPAELARKLLEQAERRATESVAWQGFTHAIKEALDYEGRIGVLEMLWEVVYADGYLHDYEASLLRRVAGLLYVSDRDSGEARLRVLARLGLEPERTPTTSG
ncbi:TerB family tellurite resistance protein [Benzoatithermus flavus]|uniref:TerB family tellurite resistance protein n=1 Tax=Benzoatithermus flavus TaxID=3108223 RepID=A0ABU8XLT8_9PROT